MVSMNMEMQKGMAAQSAQIKEMQEMMKAMQEERSDGGYGGRGGEDGGAIPKPNTSSTTGWAQFSNRDGPQHRTRERCNLGG